MPNPDRPPKLSPEVRKARRDSTLVEQLGGTPDPAPNHARLAAEARKQMESYVRQWPSGLVNPLCDAIDSQQAQIEALEADAKRLRALDDLMNATINRLEEEHDALAKERGEARAYSELKQRDYDEILSKWRALKEENQRLRKALRECEYCGQKTPEGRFMCGHRGSAALAPSKEENKG